MKCCAPVASFVLLACGFVSAFATDSQTVAAQKAQLPEGMAPLSHTPQYDSDAKEALALGLAPAVTPDEVAALSPELRLKQATAIKHVLLLEELYKKQANRPKLTAAQWRELAALAGSLGAPASIAHNLQYRATHAEPYSARLYYQLRQSLSQTLHSYRIDDVKLAVFVKRNELPLWEVKLILASPEFPWAQVFNYPQHKVNAQGGAPETMEMELHARSARLMAALEQKLTLFQSIKDEQSAEAALQPIISLLAAYDEIALIFDSGDPALAAYYTRHPQKADKLITNLKALHELRAQLRGQKFYGHAPMQLLDQLIP